MRSNHSNISLSKNLTQVIKDMPAEMNFTEREIDQLYNLSI